MQGAILRWFGEGTDGLNGQKENPHGGNHGGSVRSENTAVAKRET
jgi:hypothetical protein